MVLDLKLDIPSLPPLKCANGPFTYGLNGFRIGDFAPEPPDRIWRLLCPDELKGKREQKRAADEAKRSKATTRAWAEAQCRFYGIGTKGVKTSGDVQKLLRDAVKAGQVCYNSRGLGKQNRTHSGDARSYTYQNQFAK